VEEMSQNLKSWTQMPSMTIAIGMYSSRWASQLVTIFLSIHLPLVRKRRGRRVEYLRSYHRLQQRARSRYITHSSPILVP